MKRYLHLTEREMKTLIRRIVEDVEHEKPHPGRKSSFIIHSKDFEDFDEILNIIEALGGKCEEQDEGVYLVKCKKGETSSIRYAIKSLSKEHMLDDGNFQNANTSRKSDIPDDWSDNFEWQYTIKSKGQDDRYKEREERSGKALDLMKHQTELRKKARK